MNHPENQSKEWNWLNDELKNEKNFNSINCRLKLKKIPKIASFFAGCGGMDLGFKWAGFSNTYVNEKDESASETYEFNLKDKVDTKPIEEVDISKIPKHDILIGGFPCQPFSHAGKRGGLSDDRGTLFHYLGVDLRTHQPDCFVFENVKGLMNHDGGKTFEMVCKILKDCGYRVSSSLLNAKNFYIPQERNRIIIAGVRDDLNETIGFPLGFESNMNIKDTIDDLIDNEEAYNNDPMKHTARIIERYKFIPQGGSQKDVPPEYRQRRRGNPSEVSGKVSSQSYHRLVENGLSPTICAMFQAHFIHYSQDRNLTAREAARLQSFPDDFIFKGKRVTMSWDKNLSQYQQIGNAVPPKLGYAIARAIFKQLYE